MKKQSISFEKVKNFSTDQIVGQVVRTSNYGMFRKLDGNRGLNGRHIKIKKSIEANGYIMSPIIINENYQIIDGQGRIEVKRIGLLPKIVKINGNDFVYESDGIPSSYALTNFGEFVAECFLAYNLGRFNGDVKKFFDGVFKK